MNQIDILERLREGNREYVKSGRYKGNVGESLRTSLAAKQSPLAVVVTCSDSRVVPEVIFGADLGELFVVRVAGNVLGDVELASIEYATAHLGVKVVVVLGHTACGAIAAAIAGEEEGLVGTITAPVRKIIAGEQNAYKAAVKNVVYQVGVVEETFGEAKVEAVGAIYDVSKGTIEFL